MVIVNWIIALIPVILVGFFIYKTDREKEPQTLLIRLVIGGFLSCTAAIVIKGLLSVYFPVFGVSDTSELSVSELLVVCFIGAGLIEETCKFLFLYITSYNNNEFDYSFDMIVYSVFTSLGFAAYENIIYVNTMGVTTGLLRGITAVPFHAAAGVFMGCLLANAKISELKHEKDTLLYKALAVILPAGVHGLYDYCAFTMNSVVLFIFALTIFLILTIVLVSKKTINDKKIRYKSNKCPKCNTIISGSICERCGTKRV